MTYKDYEIEKQSKTEIVTIRLQAKFLESIRELMPYYCQCNQSGMIYYMLEYARYHLEKQAYTCNADVSYNKDLK